MLKHLAALIGAFFAACLARHRHKQCMRDIVDYNSYLDNDTHMLKILVLLEPQLQNSLSLAEAKLRKLKGENDDGTQE